MALTPIIRWGNGMCITRKDLFKNIIFQGSRQRWIAMHPLLCLIMRNRQRKRVLARQIKTGMS